jgi:hypothetical protein
MPLDRMKNRYDLVVNSDGTEMSCSCKGCGKTIGTAPTMQEWFRRRGTIKMWKHDRECPTWSPMLAEDA